jgi:hypothetical protein
VVRWGGGSVRGAAYDALLYAAKGSNPRHATQAGLQLASNSHVRALLWTALVVFARPDLVWWQPFKPWCSWPQSAVLTCESPGCDVAWAAPRAHLTRLGRQHLFRRDCPNAPLTRHRNVFPSCCGAPERLLSYAVHVGREALDVLAARRLKGQALLRVPEGRFVPGLESRHMNIMRSLHVCGTDSSTDLLADVRAGRCRSMPQCTAAPRSRLRLRLSLRLKLGPRLHGE